MAVAMLGLLAGTGCGGDDVAAPKPVVARSTTTDATGASAASSTSTTAAPGSTTTLAAATTSPPADGTQLAEGDPLRAEIETAYRNAVQAAEDAARVPTSDLPALALWNAGTMLETWTRNLTALQIQGRVVRSPARPLARIVFESVSARGGIATTVTCEVDDAIVVEVATGIVVNDQVATSRFRSRLERGERWQLVQREAADSDGDVTCPAG